MEQAKIEQLAFLYLCSEHDKRLLLKKEKMPLADFDRFHTYFSLMAKTNRSDKWGSFFRASPFYPSLLQIQ